jgi:hypothetical protein
VPGSQFYIFVLFALSLSLILVGALLSLAQRERLRREQKAAAWAKRNGYYCYGCGPTYAPLQECWYRTKHGNMLAPFCPACQNRYQISPVLPQDVRGIGPIEPFIVPLPTGRRHSSPLKW